jgi:CII-binding regulator of phage lambda lysogenization HflD
MGEEEGQKKWLVENINYILQTRLAELKDDKETVMSLASRYREVLSGFRNKIYGSAGAIATLLTALLTAIIAFRGLDHCMNGLDTLDY